MIATKSLFGAKSRKETICMVPASDSVFHRRGFAGLWNDDTGLRYFSVDNGELSKGVQLTNLHTPVWWGSLLALLGVSL